MVKREARVEGALRATGTIASRGCPKPTQKMTPTNPSNKWIDLTGFKLAGAVQMEKLGGTNPP